MPDISLIIVNYNTSDYLRECLASIYAHCQEAPEVIVVDNASTDDSVEMLHREFPQVKLIPSARNLGFGVANNLGATYAKGQYLILFNSDAYLAIDTPRVLAEYLQAHPEVSCVCPRVVLPNSGMIQPKTFGFTPTLKRVLMQSLGLNRLFPQSPFFRGTDGDDRWATEMEVGWVSGVCMGIRKADYLQVGGFDARFFMYCEDVELCMKLQKLGKIVLYDTADIVHYGGASSKHLSAKIRNAVLQQRHLLMIIQDYFGTLQSLFARPIILLGLLIRIAASLILIPKHGLTHNETLRASWARAVDLFIIKKAGA